MASEKKIRVELDAPSGPRVLVKGEWRFEEIKAALPEEYKMTEHPLHLATGEWEFALTKEVPHA